MTNYRLTPLRDTAKNKARIIENTRGSMESQALKTSKRKRPLVPVLVTACMLILTLFLGGPYVYQAFFMQQKFTVEKVVFPQSAHDALHHAIYIDATNEFVYKKEDGFYSFDVATKQETLLVAGSKMSYGYAASDKCIIWNEHQENQSVLKIFNRQTNDLKSMDETNGIGSFSLQENHLLSLSMVKNAEQQFVPAYTILNLVTGQVDILVEHTTGSRSKPAIDGEKAVIS